MAYRPRRGRRRPHHFRFRPRGFSDPVYGPIWRWLLSLFGIRREDRRQVYNKIAILPVALVALMYALFSCVTAGPGSGFSSLIAGLMFGAAIVSLLRYFR